MRVFLLWVAWVKWVALYSIYIMLFRNLIVSISETILMQRDIADRCLEWTDSGSDLLEW